MADIKRVPVSPAEISTVAKIAKLPVTPEQAKELAAAMEGIYQLLDRLDAVPLGETAPAFAFKPE
jgi:Asp-tRNA(Asn)/Glu-tRNA(Gln) amidotransferase C subunit